MENPLAVPLIAKWQHRVPQSSPDAQWLPVIPMLLNSCTGFTPLAGGHGVTPAEGGAAVDQGDAKNRILFANPARDDA